MRSVTLTATAGGAGYAAPPVSPAPSGHGRRVSGARSLSLSQDVFHLYLLLGVELLITIALRAWSRNHHGG